MAKKSYGTLNQFKATVQNRIDELEGRPVEIESAQSITASSKGSLMSIFHKIAEEIGNEHVDFAIIADLGDGQTAVISHDKIATDEYLFSKIDIADDAFDTPDEAADAVIKTWTSDYVESVEDVEVEEEEIEDELEDVEPITASTSLSQSKDNSFHFDCVTC